MLPLTTTMQVNAISSGATGLGLVFLAKPVAALFGVSAILPFICTGIFLVLFSILVWSVSRKREAASVRLVILLDMIWVAASAVAMLMLSAVISIWGMLLIGAVAAWVAGMAVLQRIGLKSETAA